MKAKAKTPANNGVIVSMFGMSAAGITHVILSEFALSIWTRSALCGLAAGLITLAILKLQTRKPKL